MQVKIGYLKDKNSNFETLVIANSDQQDTFEIQRPISPDDNYYEVDGISKQDLSTSYCIVRNGATCYGGISRYQLDDKTLSITLNENAKSILQLPQENSFELNLMDLEALPEELETILARLLG